MQYIRSADLIHLIAGSLYPLTNVSPFTPPPVPDKCNSGLHFYKCGDSTSK